MTTVSTAPRQASEKPLRTVGEVGSLISIGMTTYSTRTGSDRKDVSLDAAVGVLFISGSFNCLWPLTRKVMALHFRSNGLRVRDSRNICWTRMIDDETGEPGEGVE